MSLVVIREIKNSVIYHLDTLKDKIKETNSNKYWQGQEATRTPMYYWWEYKTAHMLWKTEQQFLSLL